MIDRGPQVGTFPDPGVWCDVDDDPVHHACAAGRVIGQGLDVEPSFCPCAAEFRGTVFRHYDHRGMLTPIRRRVAT